MTTDVPEDVAAIRAFLRREEERWRNAPRATPRGWRHTERSKRRLADAMTARRHAEALLRDDISKVAAARVRLGLSQRQAAEKALVNVRTWRRAEQAIDSVAPITRTRVARALGVGPHELS